jgi:hypothetical protein
LYQYGQLEEWQIGGRLDKFTQVASANVLPISVIAALIYGLSPASEFNYV